MSEPNWPHNADRHVPQALSGLCISGAISGGAARCSIRRNLAAILLTSAKVAAQKVHETEVANSLNDVGSWFEDIICSVPVAVIMSAAALEAAANEIIKDLLDEAPVSGISCERQKLLADLLNYRAGNARERYERIALLMDRMPQTGSHVWAEIDLLIRLRNAFMHFKPRWSHEPLLNEKLFSKVIERAGGPCRFYRSPIEFPESLMTYGCAKWSVMTVREFAAHFAAHLGLPDKFASQNWSLP